MRYRRHPDRGRLYEDFGLLMAAGTVGSHEAAREACDLLRANGIRATVGLAHPLHARGRLRVLVFPEDAVRAYDVLDANTR